MENFYQNVFSRNLGILTEEQQEKLRRSTIGHNEAIKVADIPQRINQIYTA